MSTPNGTILDAASVALSGDGTEGGRVRLRMGIYAHADKTIEIERSVADFFSDTQTNILRVVHEEDRERVTQAMRKDALLSRLSGTQPFTMTYRLMIDGKPVHYSLRAVRAYSREDFHIVIGVCNVEEVIGQTDHAGNLELQAGTSAFHSIAQALSSDYESIYYVDTITDEYTEFTAQGRYEELQIERSGADFFKVCRRNVLRLVYKEDLEKALAVWDKARLMPVLEDGKPFVTTYRLMLNEETVYISCKVIRMEDELDKDYIVIGVSNVDSQVKRDKELVTAREKANRDALTGLKSKHAYLDTIAEINVAIDRGAVKPFAVVVCDVNGLKTVNDTQGHHAGDKLIQDAASMVGGTFKHSPVFRVGGDEFVAILQGPDYEQRVALMSEMMERNRKNRENGGVVIACGTSAWNGAEDNRFEAVFDRADTEMYENKTELKTRK